MFQFPTFPDLSISKRKSDSDIPGSNPAYGSPEHFAVGRVLHRRFEPSLPPVSLFYLFELQRLNAIQILNYH